MPVKDKKSGNKSFNPKRSVQRAKATRKAKSQKWTIKVSDNSYDWSSRMERVSLIREGLPYESIEFVSDKSNLSIKQVLHFLDLPQTTYNKGKRDKNLLSGRDSEIILVLTELLEFGLNVFNSEKEKFQRWLQKPNISLGGATPISLFDSLTGIQEVRNTLNRLEYGNLA
ncbi:DUF2384 domain-containing protein [Salegentibacter mishustinae]|uniref:type II RES/Xre toxin-antitoxin system antitoxin n=1 Tax=Salegentibacter mishustinae TaxID=270918 RepID=UPI001CE136C2|nr:antitoxin Xre/MbcA/ParS toxin-binding domain-containing protein [Salegentibacter mishustinae]UBZ05509.1 DUF2384 domain-containing protein [Salegentibacter mishustinae]